MWHNTPKSRMFLRVKNNEYLWFKKRLNLVYCLWKKCEESLQKTALYLTCLGSEEVKWWWDGGEYQLIKALRTLVYSTLRPLAKLFWYWAVLWYCMILWVAKLHESELINFVWSLLYIIPTYLYILSLIREMQEHNPNGCQLTVFPFYCLESCFDTSKLEIEERPL